jgi:hypothetical protein
VKSAGFDPLADKRLLVRCEMDIHVLSVEIVTVQVNSNRERSAAAAPEFCACRRRRSLLSRRGLPAGG